MRKSEFTHSDGGGGTERKAEENTATQQSWANPREASGNRKRGNASTLDFCPPEVGENKFK